MACANSILPIAGGLLMWGMAGTSQAAAINLIVNSEFVDGLNGWRQTGTVFTTGENAGTLTVSGGAVFFNISNFGGGAVINNLPCGLFEVQGESDFTHNFPSVYAFNNAGTFRKSGGGETRFTENQIAFNNSGTIELLSGTLRPEAAFNGALDVALDQPFAEPLAASFPLISFASRSGDFAVVTGLAGNFGYDFTRSFSATSLDLTVATAGALPPAPVALGLPGTT